VAGAQLADYLGKRARKGRKVPSSMKPQRLALPSEVPDAPTAPTPPQDGMLPI